MFSELPRYVGFPSQIYVDNSLAFQSFETMFKNKVPFFVSPFQYKDKNTPIIDNLFFDIDSYFSMRTPQKNALALVDWLKKHNLPYIANYSGGKGIHIFVFFKPIIPASKETEEQIGKIMYSVQTRMAEEIVGLEDYDPPTFGRTRFLVRYPTSLYLRKNEETNQLEPSGFYCRNLTDDDLSSSQKHLASVCKTPGTIPKTPKATKTLTEITGLFKDFKIIERQNNDKRIVLNGSCNEIPTINALGVPCLKELVTHSHPTHFERIELVSFLQHLGYSKLACCAFIKERNWTRYNTSKTAYQVSTIKSRDIKCSYLKKIYGHLCKDCSYRGGK